MSTMSTKASSDNPGRTSQGRLDASKLSFHETSTRRQVPQPGSAELWAQNFCSDHMLTCKWTVDEGWEAPQIVPFANLSISPAASCLNYATQCFEGMKVYRGFDGKVRLFRPDHNAKRLNYSAERVALPSFDEEELVKLVKALVRVDAPRWLPKGAAAGRFLYIRPSLVGTGEQLGILAPREALLYILLVPWPDFSTESPPGKPPRASGLRLYASQGDTVRAWPGGFGYAKVGASYGTTFKAHGEATSKGFDQILWLFGPDGQVTEAGASNFFAIVKNASTGKTELLTAPLTENLILDGVTRRSVLDLVRSRLPEKLEIVEQNFTMQELANACSEARVLEAFVSGTAFFITPVSSIHFRGQDLIMPEIHETEGERYASIIKGWLRDIQYGAEDHEWGVIVDDGLEEVA
ncbi:putative branched-chain amino acid aminotransferase [Rosellinia necatrix]|uniref:Branched-chain-amino-acid aminotransferase n=1 Tax=Rosellinia necatrix TaxID=77044 RepID=A0A1W2TVK0_ROSNE|nr:putative branched-chain amino acid aminotransferase [Rosellinia necatrix]